MMFLYSYKRSARIACVTALALATTLSFAWTSTGSMRTARASHTATVLPNGLVLAAGGAGDNNNAFLGGFRLWEEPHTVKATPQKLPEPKV